MNPLFVISYYYYFSVSCGGEKKNFLKLLKLWATVMKKSLRNFKIVGDNVECWWVIIGVVVGCGDKKECRKFVEELQNYGGWASGDRDDRPEG